MSELPPHRYVADALRVGHAVRLSLGNNYGIISRRLLWTIAAAVLGLFLRRLGISISKWSFRAGRFPCFGEAFTSLEPNILFGWHTKDDRIEGLKREFS